MIPQTVYLFLLIELVAVSYLDLISKKISNFWPLLNLVTFVMMVIIIPENYAFKFDQFFYSLAFLFVGFLLYLFKIMGAGDTKYLFSFYLLIPVTFHEDSFIKLLTTTIIVGSFLLIRNTIQNSDTIRKAMEEKDVNVIKEIYGKKFPYAPVILFSWIWFGWKNWENFY